MWGDVTEDELGEHEFADEELGQATQALSNGLYEIRALHSNKCVAVSGDSSNTGANIHQWSCQGTAGQRFQVTHMGGDIYELRPQTNSNLCVDVSGGSPSSSGANIIQWSCHGGSGQRFRLQDLGNGAYHLRPQSNDATCLDVAGGSFAKNDGANISAWSCHGGLAQRFALFPVGGSGATFHTQLDLNFNDSIAAYTTNGPMKWGDGTFEENACRFVHNGDGTAYPNGDTFAGYLYLKTHYGYAASSWSDSEGKVVPERWCRSAELRTKSNQYGPYGIFRARMAAPDRPGVNPGGKVGFIHALFTFRTLKSSKWNEIDVELTGLKPQHLDTNVITTPWSSGCTTYGCTSNSQSSVWLNGAWTTTWHDYEMEWRSDRIIWRVDGNTVRTLYRSNFAGDWPDQPTSIMMNFWLPIHEIETAFGGVWTDADIAPSKHHQGKYDWFQWLTCVGPGC